MKKIYLIGFRGTGFRDPRFVNEPALIRAGHVGIGFEGDPENVLGFHPTPDAINNVGGEDAAISWLKAKQILPGKLQQDYDVFVRADELAQLDPRTKVWQFVVELTDEDFERIRQQAIAWYHSSKEFTYAFPSDPPVPDRDNCATFPRHLGLPQLDVIGQIKDYVQALEQRGEIWKPKGK